MPSDLTTSVRSALSSYLNNRTSEHNDIATDVLRAIHEESKLLLERQYICDAFDKDPFQLKENGGNVMRLVIERAKSIMSVQSCDRCTTKDGYSSINAIVKLDNSDFKMNSQEVKHSLFLTFSFERKPFIHATSHESEEEEEKEEEQHEQKLLSKQKRQKNDKKGTQIKYTIDLSRDYDKKERLLIVEVVASGDSPSIEEAIPMEGDDEDDDEWEEFEEQNDEDEEKKIEEKEIEKEESCSESDDDNMSDDDSTSSSPIKDETCSKQQNSSKIAPVSSPKEEEVGEEKSMAEISMKSNKTLTTVLPPNDGKDRFAAYIDPDVLYSFLHWTQFDTSVVDNAGKEEGNCFDGPEVIYFLMTFPFYEHEWDLVGFLLNAVFGAHDDDDYDDDDDDDNESDEEVDNQEEERMEE